MATLRWQERPEGLRSPVLVFAFGGWNDAAEAASTALSVVGDSLNAQRVADIDPDELFDYQTVRPLIDLSDPEQAELIWPEMVLYSARVPGAARDLLLLAGAEPSFRWSSFCTLILDTAEQFGVELVVGLGALLADVPHTRPVLLTGIASPGGLVEGMDARAPSYRGPTGIVGVLHAAAAARDFSTVSLWAPVPHYVAGAPNPAGALALVRGLERVTGIAIDAGELEDAVVEHERHVTAAVESDPAARRMVEQLEEVAQLQEPPFGGGPLPTGDVLAEELERFLRQREAGSD